MEREELKSWKEGEKLMKTYKTGFAKIIKAIMLSIICSGLFTVSVCAVEYSDKNVVRAVQEKLNNAGFECGTADGIAGPKTESAIQQYQEKNGLEITGKIDAELIKSLGFEEDTPFGVTMDSFITRYNDAVDYFDKIKEQTGDPSIEKISSEKLSKSEVELDSVSIASFGLNSVGTYVDSCTIHDKDGSFALKNLYQLSAITYGLNTGYSDVEAAVNSINKLLSDFEIIDGDYSMSVLNIGGEVVFNFCHNNPFAVQDTVETLNEEE